MSVPCTVRTPSAVCFYTETSTEPLVSPLRLVVSQGDGLLRRTETEPSLRPHDGPVGGPAVQPYRGCGVLSEVVCSVTV